MRRQVSFTRAVPARGLAGFLFAGMATDWRMAESGEQAHGIFGDTMSDYPWRYQQGPRWVRHCEV